MLTELSYLYDPLSLDVGLLHLLLGLSPHPEVQHSVAGRVLQAPPPPRLVLLQVILCQLLADLLWLLHSLQRLGLYSLPELEGPRAPIGSFYNGLAQPLVEVVVSRLERDGVALDGRSVWSDHRDSSLRARGVLRLGRHPGVDSATGRGQGGAVTVHTGERGGCRGSVTVHVVGGSQGESCPTAWLRALASAHLHHALEVDVHRVRELERLKHKHRTLPSSLCLPVVIRLYLEVSVGQNIGGAVEVLHFLEGRHNLLPHHAALLVHQLDGSALAVVSHTVPHHHVELVLVVLHAEHHGHGLTYLDYSADFTGIWSLANLIHHTLQSDQRLHRSDARLIDNVIMRDVNKIRRISWLALVFVLHGNFIPSSVTFTWICIQHLRLSPRKLAVTGSSMSTW